MPRRTQRLMRWQRRRALGAGGAGGSAGAGAHRHHIDKNLISNTLFKNMSRAGGHRVFDRWPSGAAGSGRTYAARSHGRPPPTRALSGTRV
ncbi:hypothetical protein EVAR_39741_1 [Eumeta japonica]|uniref:Uncharacterized protein n=1 Tax=Eumeta variegata TaxID=151549 RepID=A0A4C1X709_EUMVA|nr:hypothetical protein EVAR_39741_1 [Eumeta japonica]